MRDGIRRWNDSGLTRADMVESIEKSIEHSLETVRAEMETLRETGRNEILVQIGEVNSRISSLNSCVKSMRESFDAHIRDENKWESRRWKFFIGIFIQGAIMLAALLLRLLKKI